MGPAQGWLLDAFLLIVSGRRETPTGAAAEVDDGTDLVVVVDTFNHIADRVAYFKALLPKLSLRGRLAIVDFRPSSERGPPKGMKLGPEAVEQELAAAGDVPVERRDFLPDQYFLVFTPRR
jgi:hypothetical protein